MAHWSDYSLRGWLSFVSFMHIGTAFRCFFDKNFLYLKIFSIETAQDITFHHIYGAWSILHAMVLFQSAIYLYDIAVQKIAIGSLLLWIIYFLVEAFAFKSIIVHFSSLFPFTMSGITLIWVVTFHYIWQPWRRNDLEHENKLFVKGIPIKKAKQKKSDKLL